MKEKGLRHNEGKTRHELVPPYAQEQYARVLTEGAKKYADRNWEGGMAWSKVIGCAKRHILAIEQGEDYDPEDGILHSAHLMCNAAFLTEYYKIFPEGDDRPHSFLKPKKIGLDIDDVVSDLIGALRQRFPDMQQPEHWHDYDFNKNFPKVMDDLDFWMNIPPKCDLPFEPHCYVTARSIDSEITVAWLKKYRFPEAPVYTVPRSGSKVAAVRDSGADIFVDDSYNNFVELNNAGIFCYLFDNLHNRKYNVGHRRITSLNELV